MSADASVKGDADRKERHELNGASVFLKFGFLGCNVVLNLLACRYILAIRRRIRGASGSSEIQVHLRIADVGKANFEGNAEVPPTPGNQVSESKAQLGREMVRGGAGCSRNWICAAADVGVIIESEFGTRGHICIRINRDSVVNKRSGADVKSLGPREEIKAGLGVSLCAPLFVPPAFWRCSATAGRFSPPRLQPP